MKKLVDMVICLGRIALVNNETAKGKLNMLNINGKIFVKDITETLFQPINGKTADGEYKVYKGGIRLYKPNGELFAFIATHGSAPFIVSAYMHNGKPRYMLALSTLDEIYFGFDKTSYTEKQEIIEKVVDNLKL